MRHRTSVVILCGNQHGPKNMSDRITFTLDGREVSAKAGETIWEVAKREGTDIPHLCHSGEPGYRSDGNCRACMVEIDGERTLAASCIRTPSPDMVVKSQSHRADSARKMVMELLLADQPAQEVAHDKSSHLWKMAAQQVCQQTRLFGAISPAEIPDFVRLRQASCPVVDGLIG